jgi:predicted DCC family thiol-disulfide oxidoreductase YuxK
MAKQLQKRVETLYVLYDRNCVLCTGTVRKLQALPSNAELRFVSVQELLEDGTEARVIPLRQLPDAEALYEKMHVVDGGGAVYAGADGVVRIMRTMPRLRWAAWLYAVPGMKRAADAVYRLIAKRRYEWFGRTDEGCANGVCRIPADKEGGTEHEAQHRT